MFLFCRMTKENRLWRKHFPWATWQPVLAANLLSDHDLNLLSALTQKPNLSISISRQR